MVERAGVLHAFLVPFMSAYLIWSRRDALRAAPVRPGYWGLGVMAFAMLVYIAGNVGADLFLQRMSFVVMMAGGVLYIAGAAVLRLVLFPLAFLLLMIPLPGIIFNAIAFPLQLFAAQVASGVLELCGVPVFREGNVMHLAAASLDVEEACSGIRSLLSLTTLGVLYVYLVLELDCRACFWCCRCPDCDHRQRVPGVRRRAAGALRLGRDGDGRVSHRQRHIGVSHRGRHALRLQPAAAAGRSSRNDTRESRRRRFAAHVVLGRARLAMASLSRCDNRSRTFLLGSTSWQGEDLRFSAGSKASSA